MPDQNDPNQQRESALLLTLLTLFLFASPLTLWWAADDSPWLLPYLLWLLVIGVAAWLSYRYRHHDL
ncbi:MAG: hypothetical protein RPU52_13075 [Candidatus Sedimenticola sp. (ex Thyasira tokunagai)]